MTDHESDTDIIPAGMKERMAVFHSRLKNTDRKAQKALEMWEGHVQEGAASRMALSVQIGRLEEAVSNLKDADTAMSEKLDTMLWKLLGGLLVLASIATTIILAVINH